MSEQKLSFKEMCEHFDATPRTLRYYEYIELLHPIREGRSRFYTPREVARMTLILRGRRFGFSLEEIRQFLLIYEEEGSLAQNEAWITMATDKLEVLKQQRRELDDTIADLETLRGDVLKTLSSKK